ncbi:MAG: hypothetical protein A2843_02400 [Candidatus Wildermuthbacteria bacterium RIFCSPHIGHO2_01_FULL_48_27b]|uniref:Uncharacterized protein n=1 Tax=Candidatus Wildermuthbacteria bacterium RIFCSPHIGHO2_01_FULL_48_27b TaxID=1802447 RepID=A0A1G2QTK4_9BACT|nr:MAG: hypothetical protein A2843_02400 [Candidatus Wildermuthbacteria bacterium RIFCSPHIGHO2_01_FULL_48_27b]
MKSLFTALVLASFIGLIGFGVFGTHADMQNHDGNCIAAAVQGKDCPKQSNLAAYLTFHLGIIKNFSTTAFNYSTASLLILSLIAIGIAFGILVRHVAPPKFAYYQITQSSSRNLPFRHQLIRWLALFENSPTTF